MMQDFPTFEEFDSARLEGLDERLWEISEMILSERLFLNGLIRHFRPKKLLEIGVSAGGSSAIILNAIRDMDGAVLHSHDLSDHYYREPTKPTGFAVAEHCPDLLENWDLRTGGLISRHIEQIGDGIDFLLLDTTHNNPGEFLDLLVVLPYLKPGAVVVIHDISLHLDESASNARSTTCGTLYAALKGRKFTPALIRHDKVYKGAVTNIATPNIGAVLLTENPMEMAPDLLHLLSLPWSYRIRETEIHATAKLLSRHFGQASASRFKSYSRRARAAVQPRKADQPTVRSKLHILGIPLFKIINRGQTIEVRLLSAFTILKITRK